ncbi:hypothetical protein A3195_11595 [Candidatus Thiodiazotropha endoloripes]|nr:hypothetical protein A3195_11595 [Candidatus Thiodiazotropha endoloripes]
MALTQIVLFTKKYQRIGAILTGPQRIRSQYVEILYLDDEKAPPKRGRFADLALDLSDQKRHLRL